MLVIGDSVVWAGGDGWDAGFIRASADKLGVAGTGIIANSRYTGEGEGYANYGSYNGWSENPADVPAGKQKFVLRSTSTTAGNSAKGGFGWGISDNTGILDPQDHLQMHVWHDSSAAGTLGYLERNGAAPFNGLFWGPTAATSPNPTGLTHTVLDFPKGAAGASGDREFFLNDTKNTSVYYSRMLNPEAKGVTVSSWGYGGQSTYAFEQLYAGWDKAGRLEYLNALVDAGSGKLNVVIAEGFNDRNETRTSLGGNPDGDSPEAFADNMRALMNIIRADWTDAGNADGDLSFTLLGTYDIVDRDDPELIAYAAQLAQIAQADPRVSFVNLRDITPAYPEAQAAGYLTDGLHLSRAGALAYSSAAMTAIVPEPTMTASLLLPLLALSRRRRSRR
jgi:lysophospholipase L1-like esterase